MEALISLRHLFRIAGLQALWIWFLFRISRQARVWLPQLKKYIHLRARTSDEWLLYQIFSNRQYHVKIDNCRTIVDLGANIGLSALYMGSLHPNAQVICVEPDPDNFCILEKNMADWPGAICYHAAIGYAEGKADLTNQNPREPWAVRTVASETGSVRVISLGQIMSECRVSEIDILKIDIEGAELSLFSENYAYWLRRVRLIIIELHEHIASGCGQQFFRAVEESFGPYSVSVKGANLVIKRRVET